MIALVGMILTMELLVVMGIFQYARQYGERMVELDSDALRLRYTTPGGERCEEIPREELVEIFEHSGNLYVFSERRGLHIPLNGSKACEWSKGLLESHLHSLTKDEPALA